MLGGHACHHGGQPLRLRMCSTTLPRPHGSTAAAANFRRRTYMDAHDTFLVLTFAGETRVLGMNAGGA